MEKVKLGKFYEESEKNFRNRGVNLKQGGKCIIASEGWTPLVISGALLAVWPHCGALCIAAVIILSYIADQLELKLTNDIC